MRKEAPMLRYWLMGAVGAALFSAIGVANAAPAVGSVPIKSTFQASSMVEEIAYRSCWWRNGVRRCGGRGFRVYGYYGGPGVYGYDGGPRGYGYVYGRPPPEAFPTGWTMKVAAVTAPVERWRCQNNFGKSQHNL